MGEYFKPLRRKFGVMTLGLACVLVVGWVRSHFVHDWVEWGRCYPEETSSFKGIYTNRDSLNIVSYVHCEKMESIDKADNMPIIFHDVMPNWRMFKQSTYKGDDRVGSWPFSKPVLSLTIPYWAIVPPLIHLSAWMLISKPRRPKLTTKPPV